MIQDYSKAPRLYVDNDLGEGVTLSLSTDHAHYLMSVMRKGAGDFIRVFNGRDGEFIAQLSPQSKKSAELKNLSRIKIQKKSETKIHLYCAPIKKDRFSWMIEKAVELGVTDFHPIITDRTENRKMNIDKITKYIIEAAEQCERMDVPIFHPAISIRQCDFVNPTFAAIERNNETSLFQSQINSKDIGLVVGPEGGWTQDEIDFLLSHKNITPVHLGDLILRAETAAIFMISKIDKSI
jgi:16S rRNA (uracil1498-N3)-methyltransferase